MLKAMREELRVAKELKAKVIAPHNQRIKALTSAIRNTEAFNNVSEQINATEPVVAGTIPELQEQAEEGK